MDNQPNQPQQNLPQNPAAKEQPAAQPAQTTPKEQAPAQIQGQAGKPAAATPALPNQLKKDQAKTNKRLVIGCLSAFGCSILLFVAVLFGFLAFGSPENPIFGFLGAPSGEVVNVLITLVNLIFLVLVFAAFVFVVIGVFKITTARKDDKEGKRKALTFTFGAFTLMVLLAFIWIFAYFFLADKRTITPRTAISTEPEKTTNLTAPVTIKFDASKAPISKRQFEILSYNWDFGDGSELTGNPQTHTFTEIGNFKVILTVTLKEKATGKEQKTTFARDVTIQNILANVIIKADKTKGGAPLVVNLDGSSSNSPNGEITAYAWDLDADGEFDDSVKAQTQASFDKIGTYKISLRVTDSTGAFASADIQIEVTQPDTPMAVITVEGVEGNNLETGKSYVFTAANSVSPTGSIEKYEWNFGDGGAAAKTRTATHIYKEAGEYEVTLAVIDSAKKKGESAKRFTVSAPEAPPLASIKTTPSAVNSVVTGQAPFSVIFDASESQDPNNNIVEYAWDFNGDNQMDDANAVTSYTFATAGTYNVSLTVTDSADLSGKSRIVVKVEPGALNADIKATPISGVVPLTVSFDASGSSYPDGEIVAYEWNFGDGGPARTDAAKVAYQYTAIGTFKARVTVVASDNKRASAEIPINVRPVSLNACFTPSAEKGRAPLTVEFDPACSTGTIVEYKWAFGILSLSYERKPKFTFTDPGEYEVLLTVSDNQNVVDTFVKTITAGN